MRDYSVAPFNYANAKQRRHYEWYKRWEKLYDQGFSIKQLGIIWKLLDDHHMFSYGSNAISAWKSIRQLAYDIRHRCRPKRL